MIVKTSDTVVDGFVNRTHPANRITSSITVHTTSVRSGGENRRPSGAYGGLMYGANVSCSASIRASTMPRSIIEVTNEDGYF